MGSGQVKEFVPLLTDLFVIDQPLGEGRNAHVFKVFYKEDIEKKNPFALKILKLQYDEDKESQSVEFFKHELDLLKYIVLKDECKNIACPRAFMKLKHTFPKEFYTKKIKQYLTQNDPAKMALYLEKIESDTVYSTMLMDYVDGFTVEEILDSLGDIREEGEYTGDEKEILGDIIGITGIDNFDLLNRIVDDAIEVCEVLKRYNIVHRDIQAENVMITRDGHLKLIDFGLGCNLETDKDCVVPNFNRNGHKLNDFVLKPVIFQVPLSRDQQDFLIKKLSHLDKL